jgi:Ca-activated chloride channel homolog
MTRNLFFLIVSLILLPVAEHPVYAQQQPQWCDGILIPQLGCYQIRSRGQPRLLEIETTVQILEQVALTKSLLKIRNDSKHDRTIDLIMPVSKNAAVKTILSSTGQKVSGALIRGGTSSALWFNLTNATNQSSVLEFHNNSMILARAIKIPANKITTLTVGYEETLIKRAGRLDYTLPRSEALNSVPWKISMDVQSLRSIASLYSPSHEMKVKRVSATRLHCSLRNRQSTEPGPFRCSILSADKGVSATLFTFPEGKDEGTFLLLGGVPPKTRAMKRRALRREVTLVLDRSGSMRGQKLKQAKEAVLQIIEDLDRGELFNIVTYSHHVDAFHGQPVEKTAETMKEAELFLNEINAKGGTNISDALSVALSPEAPKGFLPIVLFLTDGVPTLGETDEARLGRFVMKSNQFQRRIFTFGVGFDVNTPLLDAISSQSRAEATFVLPGQDIELKVSEVFSQLDGPVLASPELKVFDDHGQSAHHRIWAQRPRQLPDLYEGDPLIILGRYKGLKPLNFKIQGNFCGEKKSFNFRFKMDSRDNRFSFVPRLWASRQIAHLIESIRRLGARNGTSLQAALTNPHMKELVDEVIELSTKYGILTEYTAFLGLGKTNFNLKDGIHQQVRKNFIDRALRTRSGRASINQEMNNIRQKKQSCLNYNNWNFDKKLNRVALGGVKKFGDRAFYGNGACWIDSRILPESQKSKAIKTIQFGSKEYLSLIKTLSQQRRHACLALNGDILIKVDGKIIKVIGTKTNK